MRAGRIPKDPLSRDWFTEKLAESAISPGGAAGGGGWAELGNGGGVYSEVSGEEVPKARKCCCCVVKSARANMGETMVWADEAAKAPELGP